MKLLDLVGYMPSQKLAQSARLPIGKSQFLAPKTLSSVDSRTHIKSADAELYHELGIFTKAFQSLENLAGYTASGRNTVCRSLGGLIWLLS